MGGRFAGGVSGAGDVPAAIAAGAAGVACGSRFLHAPLAGADERTIDVAALYAGESVRTMPRIVTAEDAVLELAAGCRG